MGTRLEDKVAFITGAARGQGRSHALHMAAEGADIIAVDLCEPVKSVSYDMPTEADLAETVRQVEALGRRIVARRADVRDLDALTTVADEGVAELGRLDIVLANAGIASYQHSMEITEEQWDEMIAINLSGVWRTCRAAVPHIRAGKRGGSVIVTSSIAGLRGIPNAGHYAAAKHGVVGLVKVMALELGRERIRVNAVHPTTVDTGMVQNDATRKLFLPGQENPSQEDFARVAQTLNVLPVPWVQPDAVSAAMVFLASDDGQFVTGASLPVDAGMAIRW